MVEGSAACRVSRTALSLICWCKVATWTTSLLHFSYATTVMASQWLILQPGIKGAVDCPSPISSSSSILGPLSLPPRQRMRDQIAPSSEAISLLHGSLGEQAGSTTLDRQWNHLLVSEHESEGWGIAPTHRWGRDELCCSQCLPSTLPTLPPLPCLLQTVHLQTAYMPAAAFLLIYVSILQFLPSEIFLKVSTVLHHVQAVMILSARARSS